MTDIPNKANLRINVSGLLDLIGDSPTRIAETLQMYTLHTVTRNTVKQWEYRERLPLWAWLLIEDIMLKRDPEFDIMTYVIERPSAFAIEKFSE